MHPELYGYFKNLDPKNKFKKMIDDMINMLVQNMFAGNKISKKKTPSYYVRKYDLNPISPNLYVYEHPEWFRSCYIIADPEGIGEGCPVILDIMDHNEYNKRFKYKNI